MQTTQVDQETIALGRCYALLIRKAKERRARLAAEAAQTAETAVSANEAIAEESETKNAPK